MQLRVVLKSLCLGILLMGCLPSGAFASDTRPTLPSGECDVTSGGAASPACPTGDTVAITTAGGYVGTRSDKGSAAVPIDAKVDASHMICRYIDNNSTGAGQSVFVPFKSPPEWNAFLGKYPDFAAQPLSYISAVHCSRPMTATIPPDSNCKTPPPAVNISLPYARFPDPVSGDGALKIYTVSFACTDTSGTPWTESATATYVGLDSDNNNPSWTLDSITYSDPPTAPADCGPWYCKNMEPTCGRTGECRIQLDYHISFARSGHADNGCAAPEDQGPQYCWWLHTQGGPDGPWTRTTR